MAIMAIVKANDLLIELLKIWGVEDKHVTKATIHIEVDEAVRVTVERFADIQNEEEWKKVVEKYILCKVDDEKNQT